MDSLISIIIPAYNVAKYIVQAVDSCLNQTYRNIEVIVIDDGSSDDTCNVLKENYSTNTRVKLLSQNNSGVSVARNTGIDAAIGEFLYFLDGDDVLHPKTIELLVCEGNADIVAVGKYIFHTDEEAADFSQMSIEELKLDESKHEVYTAVEAMAAVLKGETTNGVKKLFRRGIVIDKNIRFMPGIRHNEDKLFLYQCLSCSISFERLPIRLYGFRRREGSVRHERYNDSYLDMRTVASEILSLTIGDDRYHELVGDATKHKLLVDQSLLRRIARSGDAFEDKEMYVEIRNAMNKEIKQNRDLHFSIKHRVEQQLFNLPFPLYRLLINLIDSFRTQT